MIIKNNWVFRTLVWVSENTCNWGLVINNLLVVMYMTYISLQKTLSHIICYFSFPKKTLLIQVVEAKCKFKILHWMNLFDLKWCMGFDVGK